MPVTATSSARVRSSSRRKSVRNSAMSPFNSLRSSAMSPLTSVRNLAMSPLSSVRMLFMSWRMLVKPFWQNMPSTSMLPSSATVWPLSQDGRADLLACLGCA